MLGVGRIGLPFCGFAEGARWAQPGHYKEACQALPAAVLFCCGAAIIAVFTLGAERVLNDKQRIEKAYLDDIRQSLYAPLTAMQRRAASVEQALADDPAALADARRISEALEVLSASLEAAAEASDDTALSRLRHDQRNSIGVVEGYVEILLEDLGDASCCEALSEIATLSKRFQLELEKLRLPTAGGDKTDPISSIFKSFKRGLRLDQRRVAPATILVVDDNDSSRELLAQQLQRQEHLVIEANSGERALEVMRSAKPDLLLLDLVMPGLNGYEVLQTIRADEELRRIPVVVISGVQDEAGAIHCIDAGASDYLIKPVNATLLGARVSALLERKSWFDREREYLAELEKSQRFVRKVFGRYLSDEIVQRLLDEQDGLRLGGERRQVTVLMADIRDFSTISLLLEPERCMLLLNHYLAVMTEVIQGFRGTVDEFVGDGILAVFGAPVSEEDDADRALACAVAMQRAMGEVNARNVAEGLPAIEIGIGLNTGDVVAGNIGSELRSKYGVVGHNVNLASRIEACTAGGQILASPATLENARSEVLRGRCIEVSVKGLDAPLPLSEVLGVGLPYDLLLESPEPQPWQWLATPQSLTLNVLESKRLGDERLPVHLCARRDNGLLIESDVELPSPSDICLFGPGEEGSLYGKLVAADDGRYELRTTIQPDWLGLAATDTTENNG